MRTAKILRAKGLAHLHPGVGADICAILLSLMWSAVPSSSSSLPCIYQRCHEVPGFGGLPVVPSPSKRPTGRHPHQPHPAPHPPVVPGLRLSSRAACALCSGDKDTAVEHTSSGIHWAQIKTWLDVLPPVGSWVCFVFFNWGKIHLT